MTAHLELDGSWAECLAPRSCVLIFHLPDVSAEEAQKLPKAVLYQLLEVLDPPDRIRADDGQKSWYDAQGLRHRDYDLPAVIAGDGVSGWYQHGVLSRKNDKPTMWIPTINTAYWHDAAGQIMRFEERN